MSFVVSTCDRPAMLPVVLHCLAAQSFSDFEVIVTDNSFDQTVNKQIVAGMDARFAHTDTASLGLGDCYWTAEYAVNNWCRGEYVCFPSDDSYYVPVFAEIMLAAAEKDDLSLVYCNMIYDARFNRMCYAPVDVQPVVNSIDKTGFILRRESFKGFPGKVKEGPSKSDGELIESLVRDGIRHGKVQDFLMVHN